MAMLNAKKCRADREKRAWRQFLGAPKFKKSQEPRDFKLPNSRNACNASVLEKKDDNEMRWHLLSTIILKRIAAAKKNSTSFQLEHTLESGNCQLIRREKWHSQ